MVYSRFMSSMRNSNNAHQPVAYANAALKRKIVHKSLSLHFSFFPKCYAFTSLYWQVSTSAHNAEPMFKRLTFQARISCPDYLFAKGRTKSTLCYGHVAIRTTVTVVQRAHLVLLLTGTVCLMWFFFQSVNGPHFQRALCHADWFVIIQRLK